MTLSKHPSIAKYKAITIKSWNDKEYRIQRITGHRNCQAIFVLHENLKRGVTALEMSSWALRLANYIHILRHRYNLIIRMEYEEHDGGTHARYFLDTPIEVVEIELSDGEK
jgi:hypothetical protein